MTARLSWKNPWRFQIELAEADIEKLQDTNVDDIDIEQPISLALTLSSPYLLALAAKLLIRRAFPVHRL